MWHSFCIARTTEGQSAFIEVISVLWHKPNLRERAARFLKDQVAVEEKKQTVDETLCFGTFGVLNQLDEVWVCAWVIKQTHLAKDYISKVQAYDSMNLYYMLAFLLNASLQLRLLPAMRNKQLCCFAFDTRADEVGDRNSHLMPCNGGLKNDGAIDWGECGVYGFIFGKSLQATDCLHRPTGDTAKVPDDIIITKEHDIVKNHSDNIEKAVKGPPQAIVH